MIEDLKNMKIDGINQIHTKLFKLKTLKIKPINWPTRSFSGDIEDSMPEGTSNKDAHI
jgi:hypothetical protein